MRRIPNIFRSRQDKIFLFTFDTESEESVIFFPDLHGVPGLQNSNLHNSFTVNRDSFVYFAINTPLWIFLQYSCLTLQSNCVVGVGVFLFHSNCSCGGVVGVFGGLFAAEEERR
ncbi:hypothetical protein ACFX2I_028934 [Malus domestica]